MCTQMGMLLQLYQVTAASLNENSFEYRQFRITFMFLLCVLAKSLNLKLKFYKPFSYS